MRLLYLALIDLDLTNACLIHTREIAEQMAELGHEVTIILPRPLKHQRWHKVSHVWVRLWGFGGLGELLFHLESALRVCLLHWKWRFDLLYLRDMDNNGFIPQLCKWLRLPLFIEVNGWFEDELKMRGTPAQDIIRLVKRHRSQFLKADGFIASTHGNAQKLVQLYGLDEANIIVQELGSNPTRFEPGDKSLARKELGLPADLPIVLFAGSFSLHHDLPLLAEAFMQVLRVQSQALLLLIGAGTQYPAMKKRIEELGISHQVIFVGTVGYEQIGTWMQAADIGIMPFVEFRIREQNGCIGLKLWDYLASGLPVIATDLPDTKSYPFLKNYVVMVPPGNPAEMAKQVLSLLEDTPRRAEFSSRGRDYVVRQRTWQLAARETVAFLRRRLKLSEERKD